MDWVVVRLRTRGIVITLVLDTIHFRGNFPRGAAIEGWNEEGGRKEVNVLGRVERYKVDTEYQNVVEGEGVVCTCVQLTIEPDGGYQMVEGVWDEDIEIWNACPGETLTTRFQVSQHLKQTPITKNVLLTAGEQDK